MGGEFPPKLRNITFSGKGLKKLGNNVLRVKSIFNMSSKQISLVTFLSFNDNTIFSTHICFFFNLLKNVPESEKITL